MFLLLQVLLNCGLAAVSDASRKFENVAADNKKLKPFCMQFRKDEAKPEIRKKSETRSPKTPVHRLQPQLRLAALTRARLSEADQLGFRLSGFFRISGFGLRISLMP